MALTEVQRKELEAERLLPEEKRAELQAARRASLTKSAENGDDLALVALTLDDVVHLVKRLETRIKALEARDASS
jgi:hypothetical protein